MFKNYTDLENYTPNNLLFDNNNIRNYKCPYEDTDNNNENQLGYYWYYGDMVNLNFHLIGNISVETDALIYTISGEEPTSSTAGNIDQKAYNIADLKSWTCTAIVSGSYTWTLDEEFTYPENGDKPVYLSAKDYLAGKKVKISFYNFRYELFYETTLNADVITTLSIDKELSDKFAKGVYYLTLYLYDDIANNYITIIDKNDCIITVK